MTKDEPSMKASVIDNTLRIGELIGTPTTPALSLVGATAVTPDGVEMPFSEWGDWIARQPKDAPRWCSVRLRS